MSILVKVEMYASWLLPCFCFFLAVSALEQLETGWKTLEKVQDDFVHVPYPRTKGDLRFPPTFVSSITEGTVRSSGRNYTLYMGLLLDGLPSAFTLELPLGGCCHCNKTSGTSMLHKCIYATNAGFFGLDNGCCRGNLVVNGQSMQISPSSRVNFGLLADSFLIGYLSEETVTKAMFYQLINGAGWLVRNGTSYINKSRISEKLGDVFVTEKAPRTSVGVAKNGSLYLLQVDGEEDIKSGLDLYEFAEIIVEHQLWQAVNLDGGGSSVSVENGKVVSKPTCADNSFICERAVSSITCIHGSK